MLKDYRNKENTQQKKIEFHSEIKRAQEFIKELGLVKSAA